MNLKTYIVALFSVVILLFSCNVKKAEPIDDFWAWFKVSEDQYYTQNINATSFDDLKQHLLKVGPNLTFEFTPIHANGVRELTISADGIVSSFPTVLSLI